MDGVHYNGSCILDAEIVGIDDDVIVYRVRNVCPEVSLDELTAAVVKARYFLPGTLLIELQALYNALYSHLDWCHN